MVRSQTEPEPEPELELERLGEYLGVRVSGADPRRVEPSVLLELLAEYQVVVFDPSDMTDDEQQQMMEAIGAGYVHPLAKMMGARSAACSRIIDDAEHPPYQDAWHTDVTWDPENPHIGSLRAIEMPARSGETSLGDTVWANTYAAYDGLSDELKTRVESMTAIHGMGTAEAFVSKTSGELVDRTREAYPGVERPVVGTHRSTGRRYLNVNSGFTERLVGLEATESAALLFELFTHAAQPQWHYRHSWKVGELIIWDEESTQHRATAEHFPQRREISRYAIRQA